MRLRVVLLFVRMQVAAVPGGGVCAGGLFHHFAPDEHDGRAAASRIGVYLHVVVEGARFVFRSVGDFQRSRFAGHDGFARVTYRKTCTALFGAGDDERSRTGIGKGECGCPGLAPETERSEIVFLPVESEFRCLFLPCLCRDVRRGLLSGGRYRYAEYDGRSDDDTIHGMPWFYESVTGPSAEPCLWSAPERSRYRTVRRILPAEAGVFLHEALAVRVTGGEIRR